MAQGSPAYRKCVGIVLINEAGHIWVGQRLDRPKGTPAAWQMPQGGIDPGEEPHIAALRELNEETGLLPEHVTLVTRSKDWHRYDLPPELIGTLWRGKYKGQEQKWFLMRFNGSDQDINIDTGIPEFSEWKWSTPDTVIQEIVPFKRDVYRTVLNEFGLIS